MKKLTSASSRLPKNAFEYWGYGIYVGRKRSQDEGKTEYVDD